MLQSFLMMADLQATQLIYLLVGLVLRKIKLMPDALLNGLSSLMINLLLPCVILGSFLNGLTVQQLWNSLVLLGISSVLFFVAYVLGRIVFGRLPKESSAILRYGTLFPNSNLIGLPLIQNAYGPIGALYCSVYGIPLRAFSWSIGIALFSPQKETNRLRKILLNPCMVAMYAGLLLLVTQITVPAFLDRAIHSIGDCCASISMIFIGSVLAETRIRGLLRWEIIVFCFIRLVLLPGMTMVLMLLLRFDRTMTATATVLMGMPIAAITTVLAERYGANAAFAAQCTFASTFLSLLTIPVWAALLGV